MNLTLTRYFDADPSDVAQRLEGAVVVGLDSAAKRIAARREATVIEPCTDGVRVLSGLDVLDGAELHVGGESRLTTLEFTIPWQEGDDHNARLLAVNTFAYAIDAEVLPAA